MDTKKSSKKRNAIGCLGRILGGFLVLLILLVAAILAGGAIVRARIQASYPPVGQMVDVGGYKLHIHCQGEGGPTVVLISGSGVPSLYWWLVQSEMAKTTRVCAYDRAGYAWSEEATDDPSPPGQVADLNALLSGAGIQPPYVLVGHSYGGYIARLYAQTHMEQVAGLVMVDSAHEEQYLRYPDPVREMGERMFTGPDSQAGRFLIGLLGSFRALLPGSGPGAAYLPPDVVETISAMQKLRPHILYTVKAEVSEMVVGRSPRVTDLGDLPMVVITHGLPIPLSGQPAEVNAQYEQVGLEMQRELLSLSTRSRQVIAEQSNHDEIVVKQPDLVVQAIQEVLDQSTASN